MVLGVAFAVGPGGVFLLELGRVGKQDLDQVGRGGGAVDPAAEAALDEQRQVSGVIDVGVTEDDGRDLAGGKLGLQPVPQPQRL